MTQTPRTFEFIVTLRPKGQPEDVFTTKVQASKDYKAKEAALAKFADHEVLVAECNLPRWRREIGHAIISEKEIEVGGQKCLEVETAYAVVLVGPQDVYASISKVKREALYWGIYASKKYRRLRGHAAQWFTTQQHRFGRKGTVKPESRTTRQTCGGEIYYQASTGDDYVEKGKREAAAFRAKEEAGRKVLQPRIDAGEFDPKNFDSYRDAMMAFGRAKSKLGIANGPHFMRLYPAPPRGAAA
jgi:hypothetical protein